MYSSGDSIRSFALAAERQRGHKSQNRSRRVTRLIAGDIEITLAQNRPAVEEFERLKALRQKWPSEPIFNHNHNKLNHLNQ